MEQIVYICNMDEDEELYREMNEEDSYYMGDIPHKEKLRDHSYYKKGGHEEEYLIDEPEEKNEFTAWDFIFTILCVAGFSFLFVYACA